VGFKEVLRVLFLVFIFSCIASGMSSGVPATILERIETSRYIEPSWGSYRIADHPVLFILGDATKGIFRDARGRAVEITFSEPVFVENGVFEFCGPGLSYECPRSSEFDRHEFILIYKFPNPLEDFSKPPYSLDLDILNFDTIVHEGFHLFMQKADAVAKGLWSAKIEGLSIGVVDELETECYANSRVSSLRRKELGHLKETVVHLLQGRKDSNFVRDHLKKFVELREKRYRVLSDVELVSLNGSLSCLQAENVMEMNEGVPDFVSMDLGLRMVPGSSLHYLRVVEWTEKTATDKGSHFYQFGAYQLFIMKWLMNPRRFDKSLRRLYTADPGRAIYSEIQDWVETF
jgi:hypothetical protein